MRYDLLVVGSGPSGQKAAIAAAKLNRRVAVVERQRELLGGVALHTGTIPAKSVREAILHLTGYRFRDVYEESFRRKRDITMHDLRRKMLKVAQKQWQVIQDQFSRNRVQVVWGEASLIDPHHVEVTGRGERQVVEAANILLATGTKPSRPEHIPFDAENVFDTDEILNLASVPRSMIVVGGSVTGLEYATMFATLGVQVTLVDSRERLLQNCDQEIVDMLLHQARTLGMTFRLGETATSIERPKPGLVSVELASGKRLLGETVLYSVGRIGDTESLRLHRAGLEVDDHGRLTCNEFYQTDVPHIYAVGDVVGSPASASIAKEQGRQAVAHMFGRSLEPCPYIPYTLFTIPGVSMVGRTEQQLTAERVPYEVGTARYSEITEGQIIGDQTGMLKLLFHRDSRKLLGVHAIGARAPEIVHVGQAVMTLGGTLDYFRDTVFNYPTMAECYKVAALDGLNKLSLFEEAGRGGPLPLDESYLDADDLELVAALPADV